MNDPRTEADKAVIDLQTGLAILVRAFNRLGERSPAIELRNIEQRDVLLAALKRSHPFIVKDTATLPPDVALRYGGVDFRIRAEQTTKEESPDG